MITLLNRFDDKHIIDLEDILEITSKYVRDNGVESSFRDVSFTKDDRIISDYNFNNSEISFNMEQLLNVSKQRAEELKKEYDIDDKYESYFINYRILYHIYKELEHVSQKSRLNREKESIENYLIDLSINMKNSNRDFFNENHLLIPSEIDADNVGLSTAYTLLSYTKLPSREANIVQLEYLKRLLLNYDRKNSYQVTAPIDILYTKDSSIDSNKINELLDASKYSKISRMNLGLPITTKEYDNVENELVKRKIKIKHNI